MSFQPALPGSSLPSRRTVATGVAWSVPVIALAQSAPAMAASTILCPTCLTSAQSISSFGAAGGGTTWKTSGMNLNLRLNAAACLSAPNNYSSVAVKLTSADVTLIVPTGTPASPGTTGTTWAVSLTPTIVPTTFTTITGGSGSTGFIFSSGTLSIPTAPTLPANGTYTFLSGTSQTAAGIKEVCYNGQIQYKVGGVTTTRNVRICQPFCLQQSRSWQQSTTADIQVGYNAQSCGTVTVTCS